MLTTRESVLIGKRVRDYRIKAQLKQEELAAMLNMPKSSLVDIELGRYRYMKKNEREVLKPIAQLFDIEVNDLLVDIAVKAEEEKGMESKLIREFAEENNNLKAENKRLQEREEMWKSRVEELTTGNARLDAVNVARSDTMKELLAEVERLKDENETLKTKINELQSDAKTPYEKIILKMMEEKYQ